MIELRPAEPDDLGELAALEASLFGDDAWSRQSLAAELAGDGRTALVAVAVGRICGYAVLLALSDTADLQRIAVSESARRQGVATGLLDAVLERARRDGVRSVLLEVAADNDGALAFYRRHGFTEVARRKRYFSAGRDAVVCRRDLAAE